MRSSANKCDERLSNLIPVVSIHFTWGVPGTIYIDNLVVGAIEWIMSDMADRTVYLRWAMSARFLTRSTIKSAKSPIRSRNNQ